MVQRNAADPDPRMIVHDDRVVIVDDDGNRTKFNEGTQSNAARDRYQRIHDTLDDGYLEDLVKQVATTGHELDVFPDEDVQQLLDDIVAAITSERGRGLAGLAVGQLAIKSITPEQSIRLHKGSRRSNHFGWEEGISMRTIDSTYIAPTLREFDLLRVNKDGVMMTRTLAENYPYGRFYKANLRGAQDAWGELVEELEREGSTVDPAVALRYLILALANRGDEAEARNQALLDQVSTLRGEGVTVDGVFEIIQSHLRHSPHSARIFEVALHALYQVLEDHEMLGEVSPTGGRLKPLTQMRSADKKHGNVADIEVVHPSDEFHIYTAWDAKWGKPYLAEELRELDDKLESHPETERVGFIVNEVPEFDSTVEERLANLEAAHNVEVVIITFEEFCRTQLEELLEAGIDYSEWLIAYAETLTHRRRERAPINEPTREWVDELNEVIEARRE
ncbi:DNA methyltransferase [Haloferax sp. DFSO60]|uniref:DNA methyltransferase n=1 Tax=Haloferax sp. DFSO60 TaxID=3388652 RepID=UPI00397BBBD1